MKVRPGDTVGTYGPWANGHFEQVAIVTNVYGVGDEAGVPVNLHVFVDLGASEIAHEVPCYPSRMHALAALVADSVARGNVRVCWPRETEDDDS